MSTHGAVAALLAAALGTIACGSRADAPTPPSSAGEQASGWTGTIEERGGVVHVRNPATGLWADAMTTPLRFELDTVFGGAAAHLSTIAGAAVDGDGNLHVLDAASNELVKLDADGAVIHRVDLGGDDASGNAATRGMAYDGEDGIWVVGRDGERLDAWSTDGTHRRTVAVRDLGLGAVYMGGFLAPGRLVLIADEVHHMATNDYIVVDVTGDAAVSARFSIGAEPMVPIPPGVVLQLSHHFHQGRIFVGTWEQYILRVYDADGALLRRVTRPVDYLRRPGFALLDEQYLGVALGGLAAPLVLDTGHWLAMASWPTNVDNPNALAETPVNERPAIEWASSLDLFDAEGRFLYTLPYPGARAPDIGTPFAAGPGGALYTVSTDPFPQVRRYRVIVQPPELP